jgi:hypothetical protein
VRVRTDEMTPRIPVDTARRVMLRFGIDVVYCTIGNLVLTGWFGSAIWIGLTSSIEGSSVDRELLSARANRQ